MSALNLIKNNPVIAGGVAVALIAGIWLATRGATQTGRDIGGGAVNLVGGMVGGINDAIGIPRTSDVVSGMLNPDVNPFYDVGTGLGGWVYDITHGGAK